MPVKREKKTREGYGMARAEECLETSTHVRSEMVSACAFRVADLVGAWLAYHEDGDDVNAERVFVELRLAYDTFVRASLSAYDISTREDLIGA